MMLSTFLDDAGKWAAIVGAVGVPTIGILYLMFPSRAEHSKLETRVTVLETGDIADQARKKKRLRLLADLKDLLDTKK